VGGVINAVKHTAQWYHGSLFSYLRSGVQRQQYRSRLQTDPDHPSATTRLDAVPRYTRPTRPADDHQPGYEVGGAVSKISWFLRLCPSHTTRRVPVLRAKPGAAESDPDSTSTTRTTGWTGVINSLRLFGSGTTATPAPPGSLSADGAAGRRTPVVPRIQHASLGQRLHHSLRDQLRRLDADAQNCCQRPLRLFFNNVKTAESRRGPAIPTEAVNTSAQDLAGQPFPVCKTQALPIFQQSGDLFDAYKRKALTGISLTSCTQPAPIHSKPASSAEAGE
jgi:hypothetical protein